VSDSSLPSLPWPHTSLLCPGSKQRGSPQGRVYFFLGKLELDLSQWRTSNLETRECSHFPCHHRNMLYRNHRPMTQSTSQTRSSEMILSLSLHWAWGTWNYIPNCFLPLPCPRANLTPSNPIVPYCLSPFIWFFMQPLPFIPPCVRTGCHLVSPLRQVPTILSLLKGKMSIPMEKKNHENTVFKEMVTLFLSLPAVMRERTANFTEGRLI